MRLVIVVVIALFVALFAYFASVMTAASGALVKLESKLVDQCTRLDIHPGTEDVTIDPETNHAFVSAGDRRDWYNEGDTPAGKLPKGGIFVFDVDNPTSAKRVSPPDFNDFMAHGISLWSGPDGEKRLFAVNHPSTGEEIVEIFSVGEDDMLNHLESISFDAMHSPNDVVAVGPRQFYATNDKGYEGGIMEVIEAYFALPLSSAVYFDGEEGRIIQGGLAYANGINKSPDGKTIYIAEFLKQRVSAFDRDPISNELSNRRKIKVGTGPDNIEVAGDGALWIGGHPRVFDFIDHAKDPAAISPSHVVRVNPRTGVKNDVFISVNGEINGSSVGAVYDKTLIVGAVFDGHVMVCPMVEILLESDALDQPVGG